MWMVPMGKKQQSKALTREHIWKLWEFIGPERWQALLKEHKPNLNFMPSGHGTLKGLCVHPDHQDTEPSFYVYSGKGYAKCYGGSCNYYESNPLRLIAHVLGSSYSDALQYVQTTFKPPFLPKKAMEELEAQRLNQELKQEMFAAAHQLTCEAIGDPENPQYAYAKKGLDWLINTRNISKDAIHALPVAIMPETARLAQRIKERFNVQKAQWIRENNPAIPEPTLQTENAINYFADHIRDPALIGGMLFPLHSTPNEIGNFKLRSADGSKKFVIVKDEHDEQLGLFGLGWDSYKPFWGQGKEKGFTYILEGEFDALSLMAHYVTSNRVRFPAISAGGGGGAPYIERCMKTSGISSVYLVGDAPHAKGDDVVQKWMGHLRELEVKIFGGWDKFINVSDIDEALNTVEPRDVLKVLWEDRLQTFVSPWEWASNIAGEAIEKVPESDFRTRMEVAANHGKYLHHRLELAKFIETIETNHSLNQSLLKREITARDGSELGFVQNCVDALRDFLFVVGTRNAAGAKLLSVYDTKNKRFCNIQLANIKSIISELAPIVGSVTSFVEDYVGKPAFLEFPDEDTEGRILLKLQTQLAGYLDMAVIAMAEGAPDFMTAKRLKQGYHCVKEHRGVQEYVVCGTDVFKAHREGTDLNFEVLEGPADPKKNIIFDVGLTDSSAASAWYPGGLTLDKLNSGKNVDLQKLFDDLVRVYDEGYRFKNQRVTAELLAAMMMSYPVMDALERPILMFITGDTSSGKSSLLSTFTGSQYAGIQLLYSSQGYDSYSAAAVASYADGDTRLLALDEFESGDTERGTHVSRIMEMFRGLVSGRADRVRGKVDGTAYKQTFRLPVIFSAIQSAERPQDLNRMLSIEMQKVLGKINPVHLIQDNIGVDRIKEMAHELAVGMYPHALELARLEAEIRDEFIALQKVDKKYEIEWRLASSLFGVMAVLKFLGRDWIKFLDTYIEEHSYDIHQTTLVSETHGLLNAILRNPCIAQADGPPVTISQLLVSPEQRDDINASNKGIYFDEKTKTLLILVDQCTGMIPYHLRGKTTGARLKTLLERHPSALAPLEVEASGILKRVGKYLGAGIHVEDVVVLDAEPWLSANRDGAEEEADSVEDVPVEEIEETEDNSNIEDVRDDEEITNDTDADTDYTPSA